MIAPLSRIILRYGAGALVTYGLLNTDFGGQLAEDGDVLQFVEIGVGAAIGIITEWWYWLAKRRGGTT